MTARATTLHGTGDWPLGQETGTVTLAAQDRHRRRVLLRTDQGADFLLDLPRAQHLRDGDGLALEGGGFVRVIAAPEDVIDIACRSDAELARIAWHIGNRHVPVQILPDRVLRVGMDPVLMTLLNGQGMAARHHRAAFQPEPGAYDPHGLMEAAPPLIVRRA